MKLIPWASQFLCLEGNLILKQFENNGNPATPSHNGDSTAEPFHASTWWGEISISSIFKRYTLATDLGNP